MASGIPSAYRPHLILRQEGSSRDCNVAAGATRELCNTGLLEGKDAATVRGNVWDTGRQASCRNVMSMFRGANSTEPRSNVPWNADN
eukprot:933762-Pelagomonas_calceolata.AAC.2